MTVATESPLPSARKRRWPRRLLIGLIAFLLVAVSVTSATAFWSTRRPFPQVSGELRLPGLDGEVEVLRDGFGVPNIYASTSHDLFFAQGVVHAQDRFFQMDFWRHIGSGRLAELFGEDQLENDLFLRTLRWRDIATDEYSALPLEDRAILDAYAEGVNAYLATRAPSELAFE
ncbi:MAG: penicillin acylase family protein, partial [Acidimicrobiia bacterium]|nr:penicillin acylase family protein [Acidimicrobiia bacterium]